MEMKGGEILKPEQRRKAISISIPEWMAIEIQEEAAAQNMTISEYIRQIFSDTKARQLCKEAGPGEFILLINDKPGYIGNYGECRDQQKKLDNKTKSAIVYAIDYLRR